jgi:hypothetical protein
MTPHARRATVRVVAALALAAAAPMRPAMSAPRSAGEAGLRDPMRPPLATLAAPAQREAASAPPPTQPRHLIVVDGRRYVVDSGRLRTVGDLLGGARIERIDDSAVVVHTAAGTQRLPLFAGVVKRAPVVAPVIAPVVAPVVAPAAPALLTHSRPAPAPTSRTGSPQRAGDSP